MHFIVTRAAEAPALARALIEGQRAAMRPYGIESCVSPRVHPAAHLIAAKAESGVLLGGLRLEQRTARHRLPLERAIEPPEAARLELDRQTHEGLVELCGMWVASSSRVPHLADRLVRLGLAVATAQGMRHVVALGGHQSLPLALRTGFRFEPGEPVFAYPDARYRTRMVWLRLPRWF